MPAPRTTASTPPASVIRLDGQTALVTGANSGIGEAVAIAFGAAGARVAVNYVSRPEEAERVCGRIRELGSEAIAVRADVSSEGEVEAMFAAVRQAFGDLDILVANAGLQDDAPAEAMSLAAWRKVIDVNLTGQFLCAREALKAFRDRARPSSGSKASGKIVCMSSVHQAIPWAGHVNYAASKGGVRLLMESLAQECAPHGVRVNAIAPGAIRTPINAPAWSTPQNLQDLLKLVPYGRIGEPDDVAQCALWLASDLSDYVVGATLVVDGGMMLYPGFAHGG